VTPRLSPPLLDARLTDVDGGCAECIPPSEIGTQPAPPRAPSEDSRGLDYRRKPRPRRRPFGPERLALTIQGCRDWLGERSPLPEGLVDLDDRPLDRDRCEQNAVVQDDAWQRQHPLERLSPVEAVDLVPGSHLLDCRTQALDGVCDPSRIETPLVVANCRAADIDLAGHGETE
jgi:hypothetical protein